MTEAFAGTRAAVTVPALTVATEVFEEDQEVVDVTELLLPLEYVAVAVQVPEVPSFTDEGQEIDSDDRLTDGIAVKVAVTLFTASMVTVQVPVPEQAPLQPEKLLPASGVAVRMTVVPLL